MREDCVRYAQRCKKCQEHADWHQAPPEELRSLHSRWPFHTWGIDILGPFPLAVRQMKYLVVAIEYFTKWIEAEPVAQITAHKVQHFIWKNIACRFGIPRHLVSDNGTQFASQQLGKLCLELGIKQVFASVEHPQTNGQVESANRVLLRGLKRRLEKAKGAWAEEVPRIVWAYHTTPQSTTKETPFSLVYGSDAMIPVEIQESSPRFQNFVAEESNEERRVNLDLLDEAREEARIKSEALKRRVERQYRSKLRPRQFQVADLVMRRAHPYQLENKLSPKWTGPFRVTEVLGNGAYRLETLEGGAIPTPGMQGRGEKKMNLFYLVKERGRIVWFTVKALSLDFLQRVKVNRKRGPPQLIIQGRQKKRSSSTYQSRSTEREVLLSLSFKVDRKRGPPQLIIRGRQRGRKVEQLGFALKQVQARDWGARVVGRPRSSAKSVFPQRRVISHRCVPSEKGDRCASSEKGDQSSANAKLWHKRFILRVACGDSSTLNIQRYAGLKALGEGTQFWRLSLLYYTLGVFCPSFDLSVGVQTAVRAPIFLTFAGKLFYSEGGGRRLTWRFRLKGRVETGYSDLFDFR
ncbi:hypothetical protein VNO80_01241 [Phaseolus coccineus]|uniref:Integrase catalytic domain-containing protein n=1 Tax=Phaseolus coccineus TaxID=3886 RepID=A0AAN9P0Y3_PHACN